MRTHRTLAITTMNQRLYEEYGHHWWSTRSPHIDTRVYSESRLEIEHEPLLACQEFVKRNKHRTYTSFKQDAVRFCYKPYAIHTAMQNAHRYTRLLWIDADTRWLKSITEWDIDQRLDTQGKIMSYLGRPNEHTEAGILLFDLENPHTQDYVNRVIELYDTDEIYTLPETHDSYVWDHVRQEFELKGAEFNNMSQHITHRTPGGHVQAQLLGDLWDHMKGPRKLKGYSPENPHAKEKHK